MLETLFKNGEKLTEKATLIYYHNMFLDKMIAATIDLAHYRAVKKEDPEYALHQNGQVIPVDALIENQKKAIKFAKGNLTRIKQFMELEEKGNLDMLFSDDVLAEEQSA